MKRALRRPYQGRNYDGPWKKTPGRLVGLTLIRFYQLTFSSLIGQNCRHLPTCSEYGYEVIARYGLWYGLWATAYRVARCGPFGGHGYDPVPNQKARNLTWWAPWRLIKKTPD